MNKDDQTYLANLDEQTPAEDIERYEEAVEEMRQQSKLPTLQRVRAVLGLDIRYPDSRQSNLPKLYKARAKRRAANKVARRSRRANR
jgi:hypothetical protein